MTEDDELYTAYLKIYAKTRSGAVVDDSDHRITESESLWDSAHLGSVLAIAADDVKKGQPPRSRGEVLAEVHRMLRG